MKKRILSLMLVLCVVFTMLPTTVFATVGGTPTGTSSVTGSSEPVEDTIPPTAKDCDCTVKCTLADEENAVEESINPDCPVCGKEGADLSLCLGAAAMLMMAPRTAPTEQFNLAIGETYYFDLSAEKNNIGTINTAVPDATLHYVPFTYAGTVNAYSLHGRSANNNTAKGDSVTADGNTTDPNHAIGYKSDRSLFVADYNVSHTISWNDLNTANLIFGKSFDTNYKLRSLSVGNASANNPSSNLGGTPNANEWDSILNKSIDIKNWSYIYYSWGQDTHHNYAAYRGIRGSDAVWIYTDPAYNTANYGWRPALEVLNADTLTSGGLKVVTLDLNSGSLDSNTNSINIVCAGENFTAPSGDGLTAPSGKVFDKWQKTGDTNTTYVAGSSIMHTSGLGLTALWKDAPTATDLSYSLTAVGYDGNAKVVSVTAASGKNLGAITVYYQIGSTAKTTTAPINAGTYAITVDTAGSDDYNAATGISLGDFTINKADRADSAVSASVVEAGQAGATVVLPTLPDGASYGTPTASGTVTMTNMSIAGTTLTYTAPTATAGQTGTITVPVIGATNYNNYNVVVTVTYTVKTPQDISYANANVSKTYGDTNFTNELTQTTVNGVITYASDDTAVATVNTTTGEVTIVGYGTDGAAIITATAAATATHAEATASYTVTVGKKALTLKADNKTMTKGGSLPTFTYTATDLVNGDTVTTAPTMTTTADGNTTGTFDITISGGVVENGDNYTITYTNGTLTVSEAPIVNTVTVNQNGGNGSPSGAGSYGEGATVTIKAGTRSGYRFSGWTASGVTLANANSNTTTFTMPANAVTVTANWSYNGGGSSSGGGSSNDDDNITVTPPPADKPNAPTEGNIKVDGKVDGNGNANVSITDKNINDAYNKALADAKKNGKEANGITLVLNVNTGNKTANSLTVNLPKTVLDTIISKKIVNTVVVVDNPDIKIGMDLSAVKEINKQAKAEVNIIVTKQDNGKLTGNAKTAIGTRPVFDLKVNYGSGKQVSSFGAGGVAVEIPYTLSANEKAGNIHAVYVDASGKVQWLTSSVYDSVNKVIRFSTNHFSTYGVGYKTTNTNFTDITNHWAKDSIEFVVARGLFSGTTGTTFSPNTAMTRGMFVTALGRLAEADVSKYQTSSFSDVKADAYYMGYVEWATKQGIVNGIGDFKFAPDASITREQMAVIMAKYAKEIGFTLPKAHAENTFADNATINSYAASAVKQMQMAGVISGKDGNKFDPQGTATRAEVSAVLKRFVELMIDSDTAQGWAMNDSGKWMYYENGKALTGKQTIGGVSYTFNSYGETNDTPRDLSYGTHTVVKNESWWSIAKDYKCSMFELARINNKTIFSMLYVGDVLKVPSK